MVALVDVHSEESMCAQTYKRCSCTHVIPCVPLVSALKLHDNLQAVRRGDFGSLANRSRPVDSTSFPSGGQWQKSDVTFYQMNSTWEN